MKTKFNSCQRAFLAGSVQFLMILIFSHAQAQNANQKDSVVFAFKPQEQLWVVPEGVSTIHEIGRAHV